jgi:hypothetical protein
MSGPMQELAVGIDRYCARLNPGLTAIAIVLGALVLATAADRVKSLPVDASVVIAPAFTAPGNPLDFENPGFGD